MVLAKRNGELSECYPARSVGLSSSNQRLHHPRQYLVVFRDDMPLLADKSEAAIRAVLEVCRVFPGARIVL